MHCWTLKILFYFLQFVNFKQFFVYTVYFFITQSLPYASVHSFLVLFKIKNWIRKSYKDEHEVVTGPSKISPGGFKRFIFANCNKNCRIDFYKRQGHTKTQQKILLRFIRINVVLLQRPVEVRVPQVITPGHASRFPFQRNQSFIKHDLWIGFHLTTDLNILNIHSSSKQKQQICMSYKVLYFKAHSLSDLSYMLSKIWM